MFTKRPLWSMFILFWVVSITFGNAFSGCDPRTPGETPSTDAGTPSEPTLPEKKPSDISVKDKGPVSQMHGDLSKYTPEQCGQCHKQHYEDWRGSMHAYASKDPIFLAMTAKGQEDTKGKLDQFCIQCHAPNASKLGLTPVRPNAKGIYQMKLDTKNHLIGHGVQCVTCHTTQKVEATLNAKFVLNTKVIYGPTGSALANKAHPTKASALLVKSRMCGSCHNVVNPKGALLENTFSEWYSSDFNGSTPETTKRCQDCHMPSYQGSVITGGKKTTVHRHRFVGVDQALIPNFPKKKEQAELVKKLLQSCAKLRLERKADFNGKVPVLAYVTNINNGHNLPSGSTADRQVWVHLRITDSKNNLIFESGMLDKNGDLMDRVPGHSLNPKGDPHLLMFGQFLFDEKGNHVTFPWEAKRTKDNLLAPGQTAWREYLIDKKKLVGKTIRVHAVLRYRTFPPFLVRTLIEQGYLKKDAIEPIPIIDMVSSQIQFTVR